MRPPLKKWGPPFPRVPLNYTLTAEWSGALRLTPDT